MPPIAVRSYRENNASVPLIRPWLDKLEAEDHQAWELCLYRILQLPATRTRRARTQEALQRPIARQNLRVADKEC